MVRPGDSLTLGLLPEHKTNWRSLFTSYGFLILVILVIVNLGLLFPQKIQLAQYHIESWISVDLKPAPPEPVHKQMVAKKLPPPPVFATAKLTVPREVRITREQTPEVAPPKVTTVPQFQAAVLKTGGARPDLVVHTGSFGSSATVTVNAPVSKVQTGGFGDPNGLPGTGKQGAKLYAAALGSFDMPAGPGQGNGSGGAKGIKGTVASADFGNGVATPGKGDGRSNGKGVATGGFGAEQVVHEGPKIAQAQTGPATTPVEITFKPNPVYSDEARSLKLEGEVLLEVNFYANGTLNVNRVVRGLGHGLDEAAMQAAKRIRFKPALRYGQPVDSTAVVHVTFQMAY